MNQNSENKSGSAKKLSPEETKGLAGFYEGLLKKFSTVMHMLTLVPLYLIAACTIGLGLWPALLVFHGFSLLAVHYGVLLHYAILAFAIALGFFIYGFALILVIPTLNFILGAKLKSWRGKYYSLMSAKWYIHNGLTYIMRFTFLEFITPTPLNILFYRLMGMKIGRMTQINSSHISDPSLITMGDFVTIGGSATIIGHYGVGGILILSPVSIGSGTTIGLKATIMGGVKIGENVKLLPHSVVLPKTVIPDGETWGGIPARKVELAKTEPKPEN